MTRYSGAWNYAPTRVRFALPAALRSISRISKFPPARRSNSSNADGVSDLIEVALLATHHLKRNLRNTRTHVLSMPEVPTLPANIALEFVAFAVPGFFEC